MSVVDSTLLVIFLDYRRHQLVCRAESARDLNRSIQRSQYFLIINRFTCNMFWQYRTPPLRNQRVNHVKRYQVLCQRQGRGIKVRAIQRDKEKADHQAGDCKYDLWKRHVCPVRAILGSTTALVAILRVHHVWLLMYKNLHFRMMSYELPIWATVGCWWSGIPKRSLKLKSSNMASIFRISSAQNRLTGIYSVSFL